MFSMSWGAIIYEHDETHNILYRVMEQNDIEEAIQVLAQAFYDGEPMASDQATNWSYNDWLNFTKMFVPRMAHEGNTIVAVETNSNKIVGGFLNEDFSNPVPLEMNDFLSNSDGRCGVLMEGIDDLEKNLLDKFSIPVLNQVEKNRFFHLWMIGVLKDFRNKGIGYKLSKYSLEHARKNGFKYAFAECTGAYSTHILSEKLNGKIIYQIDYASWKHENEIPFQNLPALGHKALSLVLFDFS